MVSKRILFIADGRSPTAKSWLRYWVEHGHEVHLVSTFPGDLLAGLASFHILPVAFNRMARGRRQTEQGQMNSVRLGLVGRLRKPLRILRYYLGPLGLPYYRKKFQKIVEEIKPDLLHALRIPFEGMLAATVAEKTPLVVSIWGNDITLHGNGSCLMKRLTRQVLRRANGLMADTERDIRLGQEWGFSGPTIVVPGAGGIRLDQMKTPGEKPSALPEQLPKVPLVVNPRGQRPGSLRQDVFFQAIPHVLEKIPQALFVCPPLKGDPEAERWVERLGIATHVRLWPLLSQPQLWTLYRKAQVFVSPSVHDGLPNSLLEAMACGCFPVVGDVESLREWITPGVNGLLVDSTDPQALAAAINTALSDPDLRRHAGKENARRIADSAEYGRCMKRAEAFYESILKPEGE